MNLDLTFRRTTSGDDAVRSVDTAIPVDYRRILCLINEATHVNVVRGRLRQYSDALIADWLAELEEMGFIQAVESGDAFDLDFEPLAKDVPAAGALGEVPGERRRIEGEAQDANTALMGNGAYLAKARLKNLEPLAKIPSETVVLLVEDDPDQAALGDLRVSMAGYRVRVARNGREMLMDLLTQPAADLVLLDVMLPDGNGFDLLARIRRHHRYSLLPVIMLTALTSEEDIQRGLELGADGYITKPYSKNVLLDTMRQVFRQA